PRRRLLLQGLLRLVEEPGVLNGDHGLVREGLEQRDLVVGESTRLAPGYGNRPDRFAVTEQRHGRKTSVPTGTGNRAPFRGQRWIGLRVGDVHGDAITNGLRVRPLGVERSWEGRAYGGIL